MKFYDNKNKNATKLNHIGLTNDELEIISYFLGLGLNDIERDEYDGDSGTVRTMITDMLGTMQESHIWGYLPKKSPKIHCVKSSLTIICSQCKGESTHNIDDFGFCKHCLASL